MQEINIKILMENLRGRGHFADLGEEREEDSRLLNKYLKKHNTRVGTGGT
jgi:hypothetical protein